MPLQQISVSPLDWGKENTNSGNQNQDWKVQEPVFTTSGQNPLERCASQASSLSNNHDICRICHCEGDSEVPLIAPCYCAGSLRYVHQACLQQWIKSSDIRSCELCKFQFIMQSKIKPFSEWETLEMSGVERRKLLCSVTFHAVALTCVVWSLYVLIDRTAEEIHHGLLEWPFWTKLIVVAIGFTGGLVFMYIQCKAYLHLCRRWRAFNRVIFVQNAPEKVALPPSSTQPTHTLPPLPHPLAQEESVLVSETCCGVVTVDDVKQRETEPASMVAIDSAFCEAKRMGSGNKKEEKLVTSPVSSGDTFIVIKGDSENEDVLKSVTIDSSKTYQTVVPKSAEGIHTCGVIFPGSKNCIDPLDTGSVVAADQGRKLSYECPSGGECEELSRLLQSDRSHSPSAVSPSSSEESFPSPSVRLLQTRPWTVGPTNPGMAWIAERPLSSLGSQSPLLARAVLKEGGSSTN